MAALVHTPNDSGGDVCFATGKIVQNTVGIVAENIAVGFVPSRVELFNLTEVTQTNWQHGMTAGYSEQQATDGTKSIITSHGISAYAGSSSKASGFTIGTDTGMTGTSDVCYYIAYR